MEEILNIDENMFITQISKSQKEIFEIKVKKKNYLNFLGYFTKPTRYIHTSIMYYLIPGSFRFPNFRHSPKNKIKSRLFYKKLWQKIPSRYLISIHGF